MDLLPKFYNCFTKLNYSIYNKLYINQISHFCHRIHNPKVTSSNLVLATKQKNRFQTGFFVLYYKH